MLIVRRGSIAPLIIGASALVIGTGLLMLTGQAPTDRSAVATQPVDVNPEGDVGASCVAGLADPVLWDGPYVRHLAGWSHRCRGRLADEWSGPVRQRSGDRAAPLAAVELTAGNGAGLTPDVGGVVMVTANAWARGDAARCPCPVALTLHDETPGAASDRDRDRIGPWSDIATLNTRHVFSIDAGETKSFTALGSVLDPHGADVDYVVRLTAVFVPVPVESDNTLRQP